jgi:hypothetical protein
MEAGNEQHQRDAPAEPRLDDHVDEMLDDALEDTFPASDPVAAEIPER